MDDKRINIAVVLSAYDKMTAVVNRVVKGTMIQLTDLQRKATAISEASFISGRSNLRTAAIVAAPLIAAAKAFADQEEASSRMRAAMLQDGSKVNEKAFTDLVNFASKTSEQLTGSTADYLKMIRVLQENSIKPDEILGGIGIATAKLAVFFNTAPDQVAQFAARMKQDLNVTPGEMGGMMDFIARLQNAGVGKDGSEAITEMGEAYSKAGIGVRLMGINGLQATKDLGALMGVFIRTGLSGQTVGNNFRRIFDGMRDADKLKKVNDQARELGITLDFYDKKGKFRGIPQMEAELAKLGGLSTQQVARVLKPFGGKQGLSTDFIEVLAKTGPEAINGFNRKLSGQGMLAKKVDIIMGTLGNTFKRMYTTIINSAAAFGKTYAPTLKIVANRFNELFTRVTHFITTHRTLVTGIAKAVLYFATYKFLIGAGAMAFGGFMRGIADGIKILSVSGNLLLFMGRGALIAGSYLGRLFMLFLTRGIPMMVSFTAQVWANAAAWLANPATYIILAIIAAIAALIAIGILVYKHWHEIIQWFEKKWVLLKASVAGTIAVFRLFADVLVGVGKVLVGIFTFDSSKIIEGAKQTATAVSKIANGGIKQAFIGGAVESLKASNARVNSNGEIELDVKKIKPNAAPVTHNYHYQPTINVPAGSSVKDAHAIVNVGQNQFEKFMKKHQANQARTSYK